MTVEKLEMCEFLSEEQSNNFQLSLKPIEQKSTSSEVEMMIARMGFANFRRTSNLLECIISVF